MAAYREGIPLKSLQSSVFRSQGLCVAGIVSSPAKFPVSTEFACRRVRSALRRQPAFLWLLLLRKHGAYWHRLAADATFKGPETLIDRDKLNPGPRVHKVLKRRSNLSKGIENLVHRTKRDFAGNNGRREYDVGKDVVGLQIQDTADIEVHVVEIDPK
jgi:hypothetical protein